MASRMQDVAEEVRDTFQAFDLGTTPASYQFSFLTTGTKPIVGTNDRGTGQKLTDVHWLFGRKALKENKRPPRVVWVPAGGVIEPPANVGGTEVAAATNRQRSLFDRSVEFTVYVHGQDIEQTENLLHAVAAAVHLTAFASAVFGAEAWPTETPEGADYAIDGDLATLTVTLRIPVVDEEAGLATIATETETGNLNL